MLDAAGDQVPPAGRLEGLGGAPEGEVVALGAAAREDDLGRVGADQVGHGRPGLVHDRLGPLPEMVDARRIAEFLAQNRRSSGPPRPPPGGWWRCGPCRPGSSSDRSTSLDGSAAVTEPLSPSCRVTRQKFRTADILCGLSPPAARRRPDLLLARGCLDPNRPPPGGGYFMWKRDEAVKPTSQPTPAAPVASNAQPSAPVAQQAEPRRIERDLVNIGKSVVIKGELSGSEDLTIEGHVEGKIELKDHVLTIGPNGRIKAQVFAKTVIVLGEVNGNVSASEKVDIRDGGSVDGDIVSPRVAIAEGAHFRGSVDMQKKGGSSLHLGVGEQLVGEAGRREPAGRRAGRAARRALSARLVADPEWAVAFSDLFSRRRKDEPDLDTGAAKAPVHSTKVLAKFIAGLTGRAVSGSARSRHGHRLQRDVLRRAARLQDHRRGPVEGHRSRGEGEDASPSSPRTSRNASRRRTPAWTACSAGTCSTISTSSGGGARQPDRAAAEARWRRARLLQHPRAEGAGAGDLHQARGRRSGARCSTGRIRPPAASSGRFRTATSSGCSSRCASPSSSC